MENHQTKLDKAMKVSLIAGILIVALSVNYYLVIFLPQKNLSETKQEAKTDEINSVEDTEAKKQSLEKFYNDIRIASEKRDWDASYEFLPQSLKEVLTKEEYIQGAQKSERSNYFSENTVIKEIRVEGNKGFVYRTITTCITEECEGDNKKIDDGLREYEYANGKWQNLDPEPTERAVSAATGIYLEITKDKDKKGFFEKYSFGKENIKFAIRNFALELDSKIENLVYAEKLLEKNKGQQNDSYINVETPIQIPESPSVSQDFKSTMDKVNQETKQKCQQDWNKYNVCMNEYNTKLGEYNTCLNERSYENSLHGGAFCSKPFNFCSKPFCTY